jgi:segregation and condensation protein B
VEAILFVSSEPVTVQQVVEALDGQVAPKEAVALLESLQERYERESLGLRVEHVAEGYRLVTRPAHSPFVRAFLKAQNLRKLSAAAVEVLAIVAYKQPVTAAEVSAVRGTESAAVLKGLLEKKLLRIAGRKNVVGRPLLYATTREFLVHFGLNTLEDLPSFREIEEVFREGAVQESLFKGAEPPGAAAPQEAAAGAPPEDASGVATPGDSPGAPAEEAPVALEAAETALQEPGPAEPGPKEPDHAG